MCAQAFFVSGDYAPHEGDAGLQNCCPWDMEFIGETVKLEAFVFGCKFRMLLK